MKSDLPIDIGGRFLYRTGLKCPAVSIKQQVIMALIPGKQGLYDPQYEHDACGIGAVVNISGAADHQIIEYGKQILMNLSHRGAAGADEVTGDGAGVLCQIPHDFFAGECAGLGMDLPGRYAYGVGMVFGRRTPDFAGNATGCWPRRSRTTG